MADYAACAHPLCRDARRVADAAGWDVGPEAADEIRYLAHLVLTVRVDASGKSPLSAGVAEARVGPLLTWVEADRLWSTHVRPGTRLGEADYDTLLRVLAEQASPRAGWVALGDASVAAWRDLVDAYYLHAEQIDRPRRARLWARARHLGGAKGPGRAASGDVLGVARDLLADRGRLAVAVNVAALAVLGPGGRARNDALLRRRLVPGRGRLARHPGVEVIGRAAAVLAGVDGGPSRVRDEVFAELAEAGVAAADAERLGVLLGRLVHAAGQGNVHRLARRLLAVVLHAADPVAFDDPDPTAGSLTAGPARSPVAVPVPAPAARAAATGAELLGALVDWFRHGADDTDDGLGLDRAALPSAAMLARHISTARSASGWACPLPGRDDAVRGLLARLGAALGLRPAPVSNPAWQQGLLLVANPAVSHIRAEVPVAGSKRLDHEYRLPGQFAPAAARGEAPFVIGIESDGAQHTRRWSFDLDLDACLARVDSDQVKNHWALGGGHLDLLVCVAEAVLTDEARCAEWAARHDELVAGLLAAGVRWASLTPAGAAGPSRVAPVAVSRLAVRDVGGLRLWWCPPGVLPRPSDALASLPPALAAELDEVLAA